MKRIAVTLAASLALLVPAATSAANRVLLLEDIGAEDASFAWSQMLGGRVAFSATVDHPGCFEELGSCYDHHSTGALDAFQREGRDVYYVGSGSRVLCGQTDGLLAGSTMAAACRIRVEPELVCEERFSANDCVTAVTRYRVYLDVGR